MADGRPVEKITLGPTVTFAVRSPTSVTKGRVTVVAASDGREGLAFTYVQACPALIEMGVSFPVTTAKSVQEVVNGLASGLTRRAISTPRDVTVPLAFMA